MFRVERRAAQKRVLDERREVTIRDHHRLGPWPSGFLDDEETRGSLGLNIVGRLSKPFTSRQLEEAVWAALAAPHETPWD